MQFPVALQYFRRDAMVRHYHGDISMKLHIELRPGEGGQDAKLLVERQAAIYLRYAERHHLTADIIESQSAGHG